MNNAHQMPTIGNASRTASVALARPKLAGFVTIMTLSSSSSNPPPM